MLLNPGREAPSRANKRQVIVFLDPDTDAAARLCAQRSGDTLQTFLAKAINAEFERRGMSGPLSVRKLHVFVRRNNIAKPRTGRAVALSRRGRSSIAGWFDIPDVERLTEVCAEIGLTVQEVGEVGVSALLAAEVEDDHAASSAA